MFYFSTKNIYEFCILNAFYFGHDVAATPNEDTSITCSAEAQPLWHAPGLRESIESGFVVCLSLGGTFTPPKEKIQPAVMAFVRSKTSCPKSWFNRLTETGHSEPNKSKTNDASEASKKASLAHQVRNKDQKIKKSAEAPVKFSTARRKAKA
ncbi:unnamed protein product [Protopolystoma xenopodis]|uniref:Uncharacterized protein n=1 Tax=Protopolystoma xenopodis TaxID=117903 RepID=A0A3S5AAJ5_9PLAT|nr:unnamed protein product [Protopolystoma xenopodis]